MSLRFVLAPDSFKDSMSALAACQAMQQGILSVLPDAQCILVPMADGGEGTVDAMLMVCRGQKVYCQVQGPLPQQQCSSYFALLDNGTAVIEMAKASGLELLSPCQRNPLLTSTYGTGQLIKAALDLGVKKIIVALGGSATNDGGSGMAQALGVQFFDVKQQPLQMQGNTLAEVDSIDISQLDPRLAEVEFCIASDVAHVLCGVQGASAVFGPQKGATVHMVQVLDAGLANYAACVERQLQGAWQHIAGAGAAGGLGFGLLAFTQAKIQSGAELMIEVTELSEKIAQADYVFTGEGQLDGQTQHGKTPWAIAQLAKRHHKPLIAFAGCITAEAEQLLSQGFEQLIMINPKHMPREQALPLAERHLQQSCAAYVSTLMHT